MRRRFHVSRILQIPMVQVDDLAAYSKLLDSRVVEFIDDADPTVMWNDVKRRAEEVR